MANILRDSLEFTRANQEYQDALALAPGNAGVLAAYGDFDAWIGQIEAGLAARRRALVLDPVNPDAHFSLGSALTAARRFRASVRYFSPQWPEM